MGTMTFLSDDELRDLTGFKRKAKQVAQLRSMGVPFWVNGQGRPVVPRSVIEGETKSNPVRAWAPALVKYRREA